MAEEESADPQEDRGHGRGGFLHDDLGNSDFEIKPANSPLYPFSRFSVFCFRGCQFPFKSTQARCHQAASTPHHCISDTAVQLSGSRASVIQMTNGSWPPRRQKQVRRDESTWGHAIVLVLATVTILSFIWLVYTGIRGVLVYTWLVSWSLESCSRAPALESVAWTWS